MDEVKPALSRRMDRKKEETRLKIIQVAMDLFRRNGFDATRMEQIANEADIAKGTLYNYFPVKEAILEGYIQRAFQEKNAGRLENLEKLPDTQARMVAIFSDLIQGVQAQREIFERFLIYRVQSILSLHKTEAERSGIERLATEIIRMGQRQGEIRTDLPIGILEDQFEFVFVEIAKQFYQSPDTFDARVTIAQCVDLFINGVRPKPE